MEEQITLKNIYIELKKLERSLQEKGIVSMSEISKNDDVIWDWPENVQILADEKLLSEDWLSQEDEEAWKDL